MIDEAILNFKFIKGGDLGSFHFRSSILHLMSNEESKLEESIDEASFEVLEDSPYKLASHFEHTEEQECKDGSNHIGIAEVSHGTIRRNGSSFCSTHTSTGLADITNFCSTPSSSSRQHTTGRKKAVSGQDAEKFQDFCSVDGTLPTCSTTLTSPSTPGSLISTSTFRTPRSMQRNTKKYIWDDWEETDKGGMVCIRDSVGTDTRRESGESKMTTGDSQEESIEATRHQLKELKVMSEEIQNRAASMKSQLEEKSKTVEELHSIRVKNESEHVQRMKILAKDWSKRFGDLKSKHSKVRNSTEFP